MAWYSYSCGRFTRAEVLQKRTPGGISTAYTCGKVPLEEQVKVHRAGERPRGQISPGMR